MSYYYCTCSKDPTKQRAVNAGRSPFREVEVDRDAICLDCGHYAVQYFEKVGPRGKLYDKLFETKKEPIPVEKVKGGLSQASTKDSERKKKKRGASDASGKDKDGDLDDK